MTLRLKTLTLLTLVAAATGSCAKYGDLLPNSADESAAFMYRGEHEVGYDIFEYEREGEDPLTIKAWYPAEAQATSWPELIYEVVLNADGLPNGDAQIFGNGHLAAAPKTGERYPLVVFSHGFGANPEWYHQLPEHLASQGLVVLAPQHSEFGWAEDLIATSAARPKDMSATIDFAEGEGVLGDIIDTDKITAVGHSYGGFSVLALAGARFNLDELESRCGGVWDPIKKTYFCDPLVDKDEALANALGLEQSPSGNWPSQRDERVDSVVAMSGDAYMFGASGLAEVEIPLLALGGRNDSGTPWEWGAGLTFESVSSDKKMLASFLGAEHMLPATHCERMPWTDELGFLYHGAICNEDGWEKSAGHAYINQITTAFIFEDLLDDEGAREILQRLQNDGVEGLELSVGK